jgi:hypothetical protein
MSRVDAPSPVAADVAKLARLLHREPDSLAYLESLSQPELRALRERITEVLFDAHSASLRRLATASRLLPVALSASLGETVFGPLLSARLTGLLDPGRAAEMAARLPPPFLADVAVELDPRRAADVIVQLAPEQVASITAELVRRGEYVTMGRFAGYLSDAGIAGALSAMDDVALEEVVFVLEQPERLLAQLTPERAAALRAAQARPAAARAGGRRRARG